MEDSSQNNQYSREEYKSSNEESSVIRSDSRCEDMKLRNHSELNHMNEEPKYQNNFQNSSAYLPSVLISYPYPSYPHYISPMIGYEQYTPCPIWGYISHQNICFTSISNKFNS